MDIDKNDFQDYIDELKNVTGSSEFQRTNADTLENIVPRYLKSIGYSITPAGSVRSIEDFSIGENFYDVKTQDLDKSFNMPNLISWKRINDKIIKNNKELIYIFIDYRVEVDCLVIDKIEYSSYRNLNPEILRFGNLGTGQLQLSSDRIGKPKFIKSSKEDFSKFIQSLYSPFAAKEMKKTFDRLKDIASDEAKDILRKLVIEMNDLLTE